MIINIAQWLKLVLWLWKEKGEQLFNKIAGRCRYIFSFGLDRFFSLSLVNVMTAAEFWGRSCNSVQTLPSMSSL